MFKLYFYIYRYFAENYFNFVRNLQYMPRPINNLSGGMATQPQLGTAMGIANQIYGMQQ